MSQREQPDVAALIAESMLDAVNSTGPELYDSERVRLAAAVLAGLSSAGFEVVKAAEKANETEYSVHEPVTLHCRKATRIRMVICTDDATHYRRVGPWLPVEQEGQE